MKVSSNITQDRSVELASILDVSLVEQYGKYLGMPTCIGHSKSHVFSPLKERVYKRIKE